MQKVTWGILGTSKFAARATIPAIQKSKSSRVMAIASRDIDRATAAGEQLGIPVSFGSYEALLADPTIDAIYIPLPNHLHVEWTLKSLQAGKHVLCEKPLGINYSDARRLENVGRDYPNLKVMEAFMYRHHPQWKKVKELVNEKTIGETLAIHSHFSYYNNDASNIRNIVDAGGGGMLDIGCYCISLSRYLFNREPTRVMGKIEYDPRTKIDRVAAGILDFDNGTATFTCGTQMQPYQHANILGSKGRIEIEIPFNAPNDRPSRIWMQKGGTNEEMIFQACDQYTIQADLFAGAVMTGGQVPLPLADGIANMKVLDAVKESSRKNGWIIL